MKRLEHTKEMLMDAVQSQLGDLRSANTEELGQAIDMIKDLSEAIYYCQIVEAMKESDKDKEKEKHIYHYTIPEPRRYYDYYPMNYNNDSYASNESGGGRRNYSDRTNYNEYNKMYYEDQRDMGGNDRRNYSDGKSYYEYPIDIRDYREGRSGSSRRMYMESKEMHKDKTVQMHELEKYMQELTSDVTEMIDGASPEEKQML